MVKTTYYNSSNDFLICNAISYARFTGTALPTCLYCEPIPPQNCQLSGKLWHLAFSRMVKGLDSNGWQRSVCFWLGDVRTVREGSSRLILLSMPVRPPSIYQQLFIYSLAISWGISLQYPPGGTNSKIFLLYSEYLPPLLFGQFSKTSLNTGL